MALVVRVGDINTAGGAAVFPATLSVLVNGRSLPQIGTLVTPHPCCGADGCEIHCAAVIIGPGNLSVLVEGKPLIRTGDFDICGHTRFTGSLDVITG